MRSSLILLFLACLSSPLAAQSSGAQQRRDELARVQELVTDPDPLQRLANFEEIAASGDAVKLQTAIRIAMTSRDTALRGLAFRAYLAGVRRLTLRMALAPADQEQLARARAAPARPMPAPLREVAAFVESTALTADLNLTQFSVSDGRGKARLSWNYPPNGEFDVLVVGERLLAEIRMSGRGVSATCTFDIRPTAELAVEGALICARIAMGRVSLSGVLY